MKNAIKKKNKNKRRNYASAGNRTRVNCLEGSYAHHYTIDTFDVNSQKCSHEGWLYTNNFFVGESAFEKFYILACNAKFVKFLLFQFLNKFSDNLFTHHKRNKLKLSKLKS